MVVRLIPGVALSWAVTLVAATFGVALAASARHSQSVGELAVMFPLLMSVPFALTAVFVLLPLVSIVLARGRRLWLLMAVAVAAAPLQVVALLAGGRVVFSGTSHRRPTLIEDVVAVLGHPSVETLAMLTALAAGGLVLAFWSRKQWA